MEGGGIMSEAMLKKIFEQVQKNSSLITGVKSEITDVKSEITGVKSEISGVKSEITDVKSEITDVNKRLDSHYTLLKTLESRTDKLSAENESIAMNVNKLMGKVERLEKLDSKVETALDNTAVNRLAIKTLREK